MRGAAGRDLPAFQRIQYDFVAHIRDPERVPLPESVDATRMRVYDELVYDKIEACLRRAYPVLSGCYREADWQALVRDFLRRHRCHRPQFFRVAEEFLDYLNDEREPGVADPPFLLELADYEWLELVLYIDETSPDWEAVDPDGDLLAGAPVLSPLAHHLVYRYPVHAIDADALPAEPPETPTCLIVYRELDGAQEVRYLQTNMATARLLDRIAGAPDLSGREQLQAIAAEMRHPDANVVLAGGAETLADLRRRGIILGSRR